ncbi:hypothetical protein ABH305_05075 [Acinetobacter pittii]|uniref:hypothetical protein n=1 Tax=Acinetobacter pittii TaxID=48296 RepID=UPI0032605B31
MDMKRHDFESSIKCSDSYAKLIYMHGEKLFIFDDGKYKIAAMQLAWEIYCDRCEEIKLLKAQQAKVEELQTKLKQAYEDVDTFATAHEALEQRVDRDRSLIQFTQQANKDLIAERDELQKRVDKAHEIVAGIKNGFFGESHEVNDIAKKLEQALKGGGE